MTFLITTSFYTSFELIQAQNEEQAREYIASVGSHNDNITILGSADDMTPEEARAQADKILYICNFI